MVVVINPFIDGLRRIDLTTVETSAPLSGNEFAAVPTASLVRGYMILGVGAVSGIHFLGERRS
ncbi:hypothetical protein [Luteolibacter rhizosphaerae]|uniref:hypothetical protein n=1 Tax=Luteolibacter rhizosphaerae TaxID=2989719 RepID=UPI0022224F02|nr:hypothetical protein [Luteolibacter rhizosphaerae]